jgi:hypothetical protein
MSRNVEMKYLNTVSANKIITRYMKLLMEMNDLNFLVASSMYP